MNSLKAHNCSKSPLLITRSTQTLLQDMQDAPPTRDNPLSVQNHKSTVNTPTSPTISTHLYHTHSTPSPLTPTSPPVQYSMIPSSPSPYSPSPNDPSHSCLGTPSFNIPASNGGTRLFSDPPIPSPYNPFPNDPSDPCLDTPSFHTPPANGGTRLSNENHASL